MNVHWLTWSVIRHTWWHVLCMLVQLYHYTQKVLSWVLVLLCSYNIMYYELYYCICDMHFHLYHCECILITQHERQVEWQAGSQTMTERCWLSLYSETIWKMISTTVLLGVNSSSMNREGKHTHTHTHTHTHRHVYQTLNGNNGISKQRERENNLTLMWIEPSEQEVLQYFQHTWVSCLRDIAIHDLFCALRALYVWSV